jgi:outer membrane protein OmpA-like peptidoglycan-associated protein
VFSLLFPRSLAASSAPTLADGARRAAVSCTALALAALLGACATTTPSPATAPSTLPSAGVAPGAPTTPAPGPDAKAPLKPVPNAPPPTPLATEQRFLEDWFRGTPVVIAAQSVSTLQVDVPLGNSFEPGKADVKAALNAVLERVAESLRRQIGARVIVATPTDAGGPPGLAATRAQRVRDSLVAKRIAAPRIVVTEAPGRAGGPVQLRLSLPAPPIARLDDNSLVVPAHGVKPVASSRAVITEKR